MIRVCRMLCLLWAAAATGGCLMIGDADEPIATILVPAPERSDDKTLVIVLPGFGGDARVMAKRGIGEAIHRSWPQADVLLTSATFAYYARRNIIERIDEDIIEPAREQGYRQIWLAGASVGGMGVLFYEHQHPGELTGLVLLAPWLGSEILDEIRAAGGIARWDPGPRAVTIGDDNYEREMWRVVKSWDDDGEAAKRVWLICGRNDRLLPTTRLLATALPSSHAIEVDGGHDWETFGRAIGRIVARLRSRTPD